MTLQAEGKIFSSGEAGTLYVSIPSAVASDSSFPFEAGETVSVEIDDDDLQISSHEETGQ